NDSAGAVSVIYGHHGRKQNNISLGAGGAGLTAAVGYTKSDVNTPAPQGASPYGFGNPMTPFPTSGQLVQQTEEAESGAGPLSWINHNSTQGWVYCSNYMWEPGAQAGSASAATGTGKGGYALIGAPTYGTGTRITWNGAPWNPTVWYDNNAFD